MRAGKDILKQVDWMLVSIYFLLIFMGWLNIYAATYNEEHQQIFDITQSYGKQLLWIFTGIILIAIIMNTDSSFFSSAAYLVYGFALVLLIGVLIFGKDIKGARSWFVIANTISFQPSEIAKFGTAIALSKYLSTYNVKMQNIKTKMLSVLIFAVPAGLILLQPDTGSMLVFCSFVLVMYREGLSGNILLMGIVMILFFVIAILSNSSFIDISENIHIPGKIVFISILIILAALVYSQIRKYRRALLIISTILFLSIGYILSVDFVFNNVLSRHQQDRINELLGVTFDPTGAGYNVNQSKIAIGSGGFFGKGFLQGTQTKYNFVPEQSTDFIFCTVGEEWGFLGSFVFIAIYMTFLFRIIFVAERQKSNFNRLYGYCVGVIFFFHFFVNIGMTIGLAPVIGIPLPFFSYGGSSLWSFTLLLFVLIKLDSDRKFSLH